MPPCRARPVHIFAPLCIGPPFFCFFPSLFSSPSSHTHCHLIEGRRPLTKPPPWEHPLWFPLSFISHLRFPVSPQSSQHLGCWNVVRPTSAQHGGLLHCIQLSLQCSCVPLRSPVPHKHDAMRVCACKTEQCACRAQGFAHAVGAGYRAVCAYWLLSTGEASWAIWLPWRPLPLLDAANKGQRSWCAQIKSKQCCNPQWSNV